MIATHIPKDPEIRDNYTRLGEYIAAAKEKGEKLKDLWIVNCDAGTGLEDLDTALVEIEAVRAFKPEIENKTYHLTVSFRPGEADRLSLDDMKDIERAFAAALGFKENQRVAGTHINTNNFHMHVAYNMVHPLTLKMNTPWDDYAKLERTARALERKYGLSVDLGMSDYKGQPKGSQKARTFEAQTWQQSFQGYMQEHKQDILAAITGNDNWQDVHQALSEYDVALRLRGNGLVFTPLNGKQGMKASLLERSCSKKALEDRLGPFEPPQVDKARAPDGQGRNPETKHRYEAKPLLAKHPATAQLWNRFLASKSSTGKRSSFLSRTASNWKLFLLGEAHRDPLVIVLILAHQELLATFFDETSPEKGPRPAPKIVAPALAAWREKGEWQPPKKAAARSKERERKIPTDQPPDIVLPNLSQADERGAAAVPAPDDQDLVVGRRNIPMLDDAGNTILPVRNEQDIIVGLRLIATDGRTLELGSATSPTRKKLSREIGDGGLGL